ncbi:hypothetical protein IWX91DRAFT_340468 [Phyllosticta citricarpa]
MRRMFQATIAAAAAAATAAAFFDDGSEDGLPPFLTMVYTTTTTYGYILQPSVARLFLTGARDGRRNERKGKGN